MAIAPIGSSGTVQPATKIATGATERSFGALLEQRTIEGRLSWRTENAAAATVELARGIEQAQRQLDSALAVARHGRTFTARELISLQAQAYRYSQTLEIASKVVEHGAQTVKQTMNTQV